MEKIDTIKKVKTAILKIIEHYIEDSDRLKELKKKQHAWNKCKYPVSAVIDAMINFEVEILKDMKERLELIFNK